MSALAHGFCSEHKQKLWLTAEGPSPLLSLEHICRYPRPLARLRHVVASLAIQQGCTDQLVLNTKDTVVGPPTRLGLALDAKNTVLIINSSNKAITMAF